MFYKFRAWAGISVMHPKEAGKPAVFLHVSRIGGFQAPASLSRAAPGVFEYGQRATADGFSGRVFLFLFFFFEK